ncbi:RNA-directed DNA polymerase, eukaryota, reverse transcriptase zinc-binding domain protein [Tanacetum coccineum]|uniref:RNA-directed DNA polymerase, eukaryota, reverse transcriptase zinc-binding domain protein n=1 Tax=Tanacetum coccineum TaxID=301880 RepID=A0ABQ5BXW6_9ASTR
MIPATVVNGINTDQEFMSLLQHPSSNMLKRLLSGINWNRKRKSNIAEAKKKISATLESNYQGFSRKKLETEETLLFGMIIGLVEQLFKTHFRDYTFLKQARVVQFVIDVLLPHITHISLAPSLTRLLPTRSQADQDELTELITLLSELHLTHALDTWEFIEEPFKNFTVKSMRNHINHMSNPSTSQPIRWNKFLPTKVNILVWRIMNKRVPTRVNLDKRGIDLDSV